MLSVVVVMFVADVVVIDDVVFDADAMSCCYFCSHGPFVLSNPTVGRLISSDTGLDTNSWSHHVPVMTSDHYLFGDSWLPPC